MGRRQGSPRERRDPSGEHGQRAPSRIPSPNPQPPTNNALKQPLVKLQNSVNNGLKQCTFSRQVFSCLFRAPQHPVRANNKHIPGAVGLDQLYSKQVCKRPWVMRPDVARSTSIFQASYLGSTSTRRRDKYQQPQLCVKPKSRPEHETWRGDYTPANALGNRSRGQLNKKKEQMEIQRIISHRKKL